MKKFELWVVRMILTSICKVKWSVNISRFRAHNKECESVIPSINYVFNGKHSHVCSASCPCWSWDLKIQKLVDRPCLVHLRYIGEMPIDVNKVYFITYQTESDASLMWYLNILISQARWPMPFSKNLSGILNNLIHENGNAFVLLAKNLQAVTWSIWILLFTNLLWRPLLSR